MYLIDILGGEREVDREIVVQRDRALRLHASSETLKRGAEVNIK